MADYFSESGLNTASGGGSGVPVGTVSYFPANTIPDFTEEDGSRYLRSGQVEIDTTKYDIDRFPKTTELVLSGRDNQGHYQYSTFSYDGWVFVFNGNTTQLYAFGLLNDSKTHVIVLSTLITGDIYYAATKGKKCVCFSNANGEMVVSTTGGLTLNDWAVPTTLHAGGMVRGHWSPTLDKFVGLSNNGNIYWSDGDLLTWAVLAASGVSAGYTSFGIGEDVNGDEIWTCKFNNDMYYCSPLTPSVWLPMNTGMIGTPTHCGSNGKAHVIYYNPSEVSTSIDGGATWLKTAPTGTYIGGTYTAGVWISTDGSHIVGAFGSAAVESFDRGATWTNIGSGMTSHDGIRGSQERPFEYHVFQFGSGSQSLGNTYFDGDFAGISVPITDSNISPIAYCKISQVEV